VITDQLPHPRAPLAGAIALLRLDHPLGRAARLGLVGGALGLALALGVPLCPFALVTRHPCPGCGLTRATLALARGQLGEALHLHPLSPVLVPLVVGVFAFNAASYVRHRRWAAAEGLQGRWLTRLGVVLFAAMIAVWIARFLGAFGGPVPV
jgi:hypothetical protein